MSEQEFTNTAVNHFVANAPSTGVLKSLNSNHGEYMKGILHPHLSRVYNHISRNVYGGSTGSGGSLHTGGALSDETEDPKNAKEMYHHLLRMGPHKFEAIREMSAQALGAVPSPMWGKMMDDNEKLNASPEHYENIMRMPNQHAAARMLEADQSSPTGGGFFKALKHLTKKATNIYKMGRGALNFVDRNKDVLLDLPGVSNYKEQIGAFLDSAKSIDDAVNPFVDAAIDATKENATAEDRNKLKQMATKSIDKAIETHLPGAKKYVEVAKDLNNSVKDLRESKRTGYRSTAATGQSSLEQTTA